MGQDAQMAQRPESIKRLDSIFSASLIAHEAIFEMHRELVADQPSDRTIVDLLGESAQITVSRLPTAAAEARRLAARWDEQSVLEPDSADARLRDLEAELDRVVPELNALLDRQREIAFRLRSMLKP